MQRLGFLDGFRGIAALYVLLFHMALVPTLKPPVGDWWRNFVMLGGSGVTLFFVVSAFSLCLTMGRHTATGAPLLSYGTSRFFRIAPLFYAVMAVTYVFHIVSFGVWHPPGTVLLSLSFVFNLVPGASEGYVWASWTIGVEMLFYVVFPFLYFWQTTPSRKIAAFCGAVALGILFKGVSLGFVPEPLRGSFEGFSIFRHLPSFLIGMLAYDFYVSARWEKLRHEYAAAFLAGGLLLLVGVAAGRIAGGLLDVTHIIAAGYALMLLGASARPVTLIDNAFTRFVGKISYSVYLSHAPVVWLMSRVYGRISELPLPTTLRFLLCLLATLCVVLPLSWLAYRLVELPGIALGKRVFAVLAARRRRLPAVEAVKQAA